MKLCDFLECVDSDIVIRFKGNYVKFSCELCGEEDIQDVFAKKFLDQYVYSVSIEDNCLKVVLATANSEEW